MLTLSEIQQRHDRGLLVLAWVSAQDLLNEPLVLCIEFEGNRGIVLGGVAVLDVCERVLPVARRGGRWTYDIEVVTPYSRRDLKRALLESGRASDCSRSISESPGSEFGGHCGWCWRAMEAQSFSCRRSDGRIEVQVVRGGQLSQPITDDQFEDYDDTTFCNQRLLDPPTIRNNFDDCWISSTTVKYDSCK